MSWWKLEWYGTLHHTQYKEKLCGLHSNFPSWKPQGKTSTNVNILPLPSTCPKFLELVQVMVLFPGSGWLLHSLVYITYRTSSQNSGLITRMIFLKVWSYKDLLLWLYFLFRKEQKLWQSNLGVTLKQSSQALGTVQNQYLKEFHWSHCQKQKYKPGPGSWIMLIEMFCLYIGLLYKNFHLWDDCKLNFDSDLH